VNQTVYVETSIPSFYFESRGGSQMLATWNCKHIANPNKTDHIRMVNSALGLHTPQLVTPFELLEAMP
jgi:hypothetical protein